MPRRCAAATCSCSTPPTPEDWLRRELCAREIRAHVYPSRAQRMDGARAISRLAQMARPSGARRPAAGRRGDDSGIRALGAEIRRAHRRASAFQARHRSARARAERSRRCSAPSTAISMWCSLPTTRSISPAQVPYRLVRPRPVIGSIDLEPVAWHWTWERNGAPQVNSRFQKITGGRHMEGRRLGGLDGGQDDRAGGAAHALGRFQPSSARSSSATAISTAPRGWR